MSMDGGAYSEDAQMGLVFNPANFNTSFIDPMFAYKSQMFETDAMTKDGYWAGYADQIKQSGQNMTLPAYQTQKVGTDNLKRLTPIVFVLGAAAVFLILTLTRKS